jgi:hypothetical protein
MLSTQFNPQTDDVGYRNITSASDASSEQSQLHNNRRSTS